MAPSDTRRVAAVPVPDPPKKASHHQAKAFDWLWVLTFTFNALHVSTGFTTLYHSCLSTSSPSRSPVVGTAGSDFTGRDVF